jgi:PHD/YefM family antitoxin component YafN of YafNO toxin-antitoxin module
MIHTITLKALRPGLPKIAAALSSRLDRYLVTKRGKPVMVLLNPEDLEGLLETIEILSDRTALKRIRRAWHAARTGKTESLAAIRQRLERV